MPAYKDKSTGNWYVSFYYEDYSGVSQRKLKRGFKKKSEALDFEREFLLNQQGNPDITFKALYEDYMEDCKHRLRPTTYEGKRYIYESKILPFFSKLPINKISVRSIRKWQNWLLSLKNKHNKPLSLTYIKTINNQLSAILNYAVKFYDLNENPLHRSGSIGKKNAEDMSFWTLTEFNTAMSYFADDNPLYFQYKFIFTLLFYTGIRQGELLALTLNDFDRKSQTLSITKSLARLNGEVLINKPKTPKSKRAIALSDFLFTMLDKYLESLSHYEPDQLLFQTQKHSLRKQLQKAADFTNTKEIRIHDLRHSHASLLIEMEVNILLVQERLGHENIETTLQTYSHLYPNKQMDLATQLDNMVSKQYQQ